MCPTGLFGLSLHSGGVKGPVCSTLPRVATLTCPVAMSCQSCCAAPRNGLWGEHSWRHRLSWARKIASDSSMVWVTPCLTRGAYPSFTPPGMSSPGAKAAPQGNCAPQTIRGEPRTVMAMAYGKTTNANIPQKGGAMAPSFFTVAVGHNCPTQPSQVFCLWDICRQKPG